MRNIFSSGIVDINLELFEDKIELTETLAWVALLEPYYK